MLIGTYVPTQKTQINKHKQFESIKMLICYSRMVNTWQGVKFSVGFIRVEVENHTQVGFSVENQN